MPPFSATSVLTVKEKVDALLQQGDRLYVAYGGSGLRVYRLEEDGSTELLETRKTFSRRAVDQIGLIREINSLVVLSDSTISLYDPSTLVLLSSLPQTRGAQTFTFLSHIATEDPSASSESAPALTTLLLVGLKKRLAIFKWTDGLAVPPPEPLSLPHTPRSVAFLSPTRAVVAYTSNEQALIGLDPLRIILAELPGPVLKAEAPGAADRPSSVAGAGLGSLGLSSMTGYIGLGSGKGKASVERMAENNVFISRDAAGFSFFVGDRRESSSSNPPVEWALPPEETVFARPFLLSIFPAIPASLLPSALSSSSSSSSPQPTIQIRSSHTLQLLQSFHLPATTSSHTLHHLTPSTSSSQVMPKPPLFFVSTPTERAALASEGGSKIYRLDMASMGSILDDLTLAEEYEEGLALLRNVDDRLLPDKEKRRVLLETLQALALFRSSSPKSAQKAIDAFIELEVTPAKVIALFPSVVSGHLMAPEETWTELFGGPARSAATALPLDGEQSEEAKKEESMGAGKKAVLGTLAAIGLGHRDQEGGADGAKAERDEEKKTKQAVSQKEAYEALFYYLSDRRQKVLGALPSIPSTTLAALESKLPPFSTIAKSHLFDIPSLPIGTLTPEQIFRVAQTVDTSLFKAYLAVRPSLVGSLCRLENFCEVTEVEQQLKDRKKYSDLVDLYRTRKNHDKALKLLKELSKDETDLEDKLEPTVRYLLALGPNHLTLIFETSRWVFKENFDWAMKIFTADPDTVEPLPRQPVLAHLETISPQAATAFLDFLIDKLGDEEADFHDRLATLYLTEAKKSKAADRGRPDGPYSTALRFLSSSTNYRPGNILRFVPEGDLFEARAILLGRLGNHTGALEIYVHRLKDFSKAEAYCLRTYQEEPSVNVFLPLLRIYLLPRPPHNTLLLPPALALIATHSTKLEAMEVISLLPPLLTMQDVEPFFMRTLREGTAQRNDARVLRELVKARSEQIDRSLMKLQERRVKITDSRICPQCKKRLGNSVVAVHAPRGEVTHHHCKDAFSRARAEA